MGAHTWARALLALITSKIGTCETLSLIAVKGGPACDEECAFIFVLLLELGLTCTRDQVWDFEEDKLIMDAVWELERKGAKNFCVQLTQYRDVDCADCLTMKFSPQP